MRLALEAAVTAAVLSSLTATAAKPRMAHTGAAEPPVQVTITAPPILNDSNEQARRVASEEAAQQVIDEGVPTARNLPPPRSLAGGEAPPQDPVDLIVYFGILGLLLVAGVGILYRYLAFRFSLDMAPEVPDAETESPADRVALPEQGAGLSPRDPRRPVARPAQAAPRAAPPAPAAKAAPSPPAVVATAPRREAQKPPSEEQLLGQAAKILSGRGDWMTVGGIAEALQADEWTTSKVLESLTDSGRVQEAKAQNGQTVYRYAR